MVLIKIFLLFSILGVVVSDDFKNLQVLDIKSKSEMRKYMKKISKELGVKCSHCHDMDDKSLDTPEKEISREMIVLTRQINDYLFSISQQDTMHNKKQSLVSCWTCHKGNLKVENKKPDTN